VLAVGEDPDAPGRRLLVGVKNNLGPIAASLAFRICDDGLRWEGTVEGTADQLLAVDEAETRSARTERDEAKAFLRDLLMSGPVKSKQIETDAQANGISRATLWRAKQALGIKAERGKTIEGNTGPWYWYLPS
jgi:putative DNA primase/helicase